MNNELVPQPSWWKRNWKWALPVGGCFTMIIIFIAVIVSIFYGVTAALEDSQPYQYGLEVINNDDEITNVLGSPIEKDGMIQGSFNNSNGNKTANMKIPVAGPKGSGMVYIEATGTGDDWTYHVIRVEIKDNESIDLLETDLEMF